MGFNSVFKGLKKKKCYTFLFVPLSPIMGGGKYLYFMYMTE